MSQTIPVDSATADSLVERVFGSVLGALDVFSIYVGDRLGYYRSLTEELSLAYITPFARMIVSAGFQLPKVVEAHRSERWCVLGRVRRRHAGVPGGPSSRPALRRGRGSSATPSVIWAVSSANMTRRARAIDQGYRSHDFRRPFRFV